MSKKKTKQNTEIKSRPECGATRTFIHLWLLQIWNIVWKFLIKLNIRFIIWPNNFLLRRNNIFVQILWVSIYSRFIISTNLETMPVTFSGEWIINSRNNHIMGYYSSKKEDNFLVNHKWIILNKRKLAQMPTCYIISFIWNFGKGKMMEQESV